VKLALRALLVLAILVIGYLGVGLVLAAQLSAPSHHPQELTPTDVGLNYHEVSVHSTDGLELVGWWVPRNDPSRAVVLVPGIEGDKSDRHVLKSASVYAGAGYAVLMIDLRAQGGSEAERVTMGHKEVRDVRRALLWLNERGLTREEVVLHGFSLGGATVLQVAPKSGVAAVVEESVYSDLPLILR
jgi:dipeptidyl aminopeptidase/acylaminoacyl peptidase